MLLIAHPSWILPGPNDQSSYLLLLCVEMNLVVCKVYIYGIKTIGLFFQGESLLIALLGNIILVSVATTRNLNVKCIIIEPLFP